MRFACKINLALCRVSQSKPKEPLTHTWSVGMGWVGSFNPNTDSVFETHHETQILVGVFFLRLLPKSYKF